MIPDKIYIDIIDMDSGYMMAPSFENNGGAEYIRKDALLEWLEERINDGDEEGLMTNQIANFAYKDVIDKLNSM